MARPETPQYVAGYRPQLDVGVFQHLLNAVGDAGLLAHPLRAVPSQVSQFPLSAGGDKAPFQKPMLQQLGDPLRVPDIALASRHALQMLGVDQQHREEAFQQIVNRLPEDPGRFHGHVGHPLGFHPIRQRQQVGSHRPPAAGQLVQATAGLLPPPRRFHGLLVHIQTSTTTNPGLHRRLLSDPAPGDIETRTFCLACSRGGEATISGSARCLGQTISQARGSIIVWPRPCAGRFKIHPLPPIFMLSG